MYYIIVHPVNGDIIFYMGILIMIFDWILYNYVLIVTVHKLCLIKYCGNSFYVLNLWLVVFLHFLIKLNVS